MTFEMAFERKGFLVMGLLFTIASSFNLAKAVRDSASDSELLHPRFVCDPSYRSSLARCTLLSHPARPDLDVLTEACLMGEGIQVFWNGTVTLDLPVPLGLWLTVLSTGYSTSALSSYPWG